MAITEKLTAIADAIREQSGKTDKIALGDMPNEILNLLNFDVVRYASKADLPKTAKENTIAVFSGTDISCWKFSPSEPTEPIDGMVWFPIGASSSVSFNVLKKNDIEVHPLSAKQHIGGAWESVEAEIYQNEEWVGWVKYIFRSGEGEKIKLNVYAQNGATVKVDDNGITQNFSAGNIIAKIQTEVPQSLTDKNVICARVKCVRKYTNDAQYTVRLAISKDAKTDHTNNTAIASAYFEANSVETVYEIPVTASGDYYVYIWGVGEYTLYDWWIR